MNETDLKLHLGCGDKYLEGYLNIDFPQSEHSVMKVKADRYADIATLHYPSGSIAEIRGHHVFEHFRRADALRLLLEWRRWLKPHGVLHLETPDFATSIFYYLFGGTKERYEISRHVFGSQEAAWAFHGEGWNKEKYKFVLKKLGFGNLRFRKISNDLAKRFQVPALNIPGMFIPLPVYRKFGGKKLPNITVFAERLPGEIDEKKAVREILSRYLVGREGEAMLDVWMKDVFSS